MYTKETKMNLYLGIESFLVFHCGMKSEPACKFLIVWISFKKIYT